MRRLVLFFGALVCSGLGTFAQGVSEIQIDEVMNAKSLSGIVTLGQGGGIRGALVEGCSNDWNQPILSSARTDKHAQHGIANPPFVTPPPSLPPPFSAKLLTWPVWRPNSSPASC